MSSMLAMPASAYLSSEHEGQVQQRAHARHLVALALERSPVAGRHGMLGRYPHGATEMDAITYSLRLYASSGSVKMSVQHWTFAVVQAGCPSAARARGVPHCDGRSPTAACGECARVRSASRADRRDHAARSRKPVPPWLRAWLYLMLCAPMLIACGTGDPAEDVTLAELVARPQAYDGRAVRTRGTVRAFDAPRHYWLEDAQINRVGLEPMALIAPHLGREVTVTGRFSYARERGRRIAIATIEPFDAPR